MKVLVYERIDSPEKGKIDKYKCHKRLLRGENTREPYVYIRGQKAYVTEPTGQNKQVFIRYWTSK